VRQQKIELGPLPLGELAALAVALEGDHGARGALNHHLPAEAVLHAFEAVKVVIYFAAPEIPLRHQLLADIGAARRDLQPPQGPRSRLWKWSR
jgi:hypothetical protein